MQTAKMLGMFSIYDLYEITAYKAIWQKTMSFMW